MTAIRPTGTRKPAPHPTRQTDAPRGRKGVASAPYRSDAWDVAMTGLLHEAAELRESRDRARLTEDSLQNEREMAALRDLIRARARPSVKHYTQHALMRRAPRAAEAIR